MEITLGTPALLFPAITLLMLAYTNRFLGLAALIRNLHHRWTQNRDAVLIAQIQNLRRRLGLIRRMQALGVLSLLVCVVCMFVLFTGHQTAGKVLFGISLLLLLASLVQSLLEIHISTEALKIELARVEGDEPLGPSNDL